MLAWLSAVALAGLPIEARGDADVVQPEIVADGGLTFLGFVQSRATLTSLSTTSPYMDGQVVGVLGGINGTTVSDEAPASYVEYRTNGFFTYAPKALNGRASLTAGFEIDYAFGDQSYMTGGNVGGGFGADQVNLQTRRLHATFRPELPAGHHLSLVVGLQFLADGVYDPQTSRPDDLFRAGGGLRFFGSEAAGLTAYGRYDDAAGELLRYRLGSYTLHEQGLSVADDVTLHMADAQITPAYGVRIGGHAWYLRDRSGGTAGILGAGASSALSELQGGPRLDFREDGTGQAPALDADLLWLVADGGYNHALDRGPLGVSAVVATNIAGFYATGVPDITGVGTMWDLEVRYRWAQGDGSVLRADILHTSDDDPHIPGYGGVMTGNSYGIVGAVWPTHGSMLLFPDPGAINRQVAVVYDVSNGGAGLLALSGDVGWDPVPNRVNVRAGFAHATNAVGQSLGTELNGRLRARPLPLCDVGIAAAMVLGTSQPATPWTAITYLEWVVF